MQPVVSFWRVFSCLWYRFFLCASLRHLPVPLVRAFAVPQGRVFVDCSAVERTARGNRALPCYFLLPYGITTENQLFNIFIYNYFEIVDKIIPL